MEEIKMGLFMGQKHNLIQTIELTRQFFAHQGKL